MGGNVHKVRVMYFMFQFRDERRINRNHEGT